MQAYISRRRLSEHSKGRVDHSFQDPAFTPPKPSLMLTSPPVKGGRRQLGTSSG